MEHKRKRVKGEDKDEEDLDDNAQGGDGVQSSQVLCGDEEAAESQKML